MTITTRDQLIGALASSSTPVFFDKASIANTVAGQLFSLWRATGFPAQGAIPGAAAICTSALAGAVPFANQTSPVTSYHALQTVASSLALASFDVSDRLAHMGGLNGTLLTAQPVGVDLSTLAVPAARIGAANFSAVQWVLEWYADTGATASSATVAVTYDDGSTGTLPVIAVGGTVRAGREIPLLSAVAGRYIRGVVSVTLSASTGAAGNFGVTARVNESSLATYVINRYETYDWAQLGLPNIANDSCLYLSTLCTSTTTGTVRGFGRLAHG